ncbi:hypothetical protein FACS189421_01470 [Bacteroidia bacterium]|nr:hypothetical protein FACS189421_01470 [Bacteroidia bacterium]GHT46037.1 hypothetical protein FACS189440_03200 [Bacteroidia bacterium]
MVLFYSCSDDSDSYSYNEPTIYSNNNKILFSEVVFFMKPYVMDAGQKKYIVTDKLSNLSLKIGTKIVSVSDSYVLDVAHVNPKKMLGEYNVTEQPIHYPVVMGVTMIPDSLTTAGEYADLLNDYLNLQPGIYVCRIISFDIQTISGELKTIYTPTLSFPLEVKENIVSVNLGEFEVEIK